jgi:hypothetical protein
MEKSEVADDILALFLLIITGLIEHVIKHPIGSITACLGLLLMYERYRSQRMKNKIIERRLKNIDKDE